ncbi:MAG TPA: hypothetical protein VKZ97_03850 [Flavobacteriaceae bacterium]|nr:hypothetical protein [Flavobacteriaceae bacterium]
MRQYAFLVLLLLSVLASSKSNGQEYYSINGSDNITEVVRNGLNNIPHLQASGVSGNLTHILAINNTGASFGVIGTFSVSTLTVNMPDGKSFNYHFNGTDAFICNELPSGTSMGRIGGHAVYLTVSSASALGENIVVKNPASITIAFSYENKQYYGKIPLERLTKYGTVRGKDGNLSFAGTDKEVANIMAVQPYASLSVSGITTISSNGYVRAVERVRADYSNWLEQQKAQTNSSSAQGTTPTLTASSSATSQVTNSQNKSTTAQSNSGSNKASNDIYDKAETAGKTLEQMEYEREAYQRQQQEKLQQATNPGGYYMEKSGVNAYFDAQHARLNKEAAEKEAREEREWLAKKRREEREYREAQQREEEYRKQREAENKRIASEQKQTKDSHYAALGGEANFNAKRKTFSANAAKKMETISYALSEVKAPFIWLDPFDNCSYVKVIETIQASKLSFFKKSMLIQDILKIRDEHHYFYQQNSYDGAYKITGRDLKNYSCGNYLDVVWRLKNSFYDEDYKSYTDYTFGSLNNGIGYYWMKNDKESQYNGIKTDFGEDIKALDISFWGTNADQLYNWMWSEFHVKRKKWSDGELSNYKNKKTLFGEEFKKEEQRFIDFLLLRRKHLLSTPDTDFKLAYFTYKAGKMNEAIHYFKTYVFRKFGSFENMRNYYMKTDFKKGSYDLKPYIESGSIDEQVFPQIFMAAIIYYQAGEYDKAQQITQTITYNTSLNLANSHQNQEKMAILKGFEALLYDCYFEQEKWQYIYLPKTDKEFKDTNFGNNNISVMKAYAALKSGNEKWAKKIFSETYNFYSKKITYSRQLKSVRDYPTFHGTKPQVEAYKYLIEKLYPKFYPEIKTDTRNYTLITYNENYGGHYGALKIDSYNNAAKSVPLIFEPSNLKENLQWLEVKNQLLTARDKTTMEQAFAFCHEYFSTHSFDKNEEDLAFLQQYYSIGIALGKFYEVMPAMLVLADLSELSKEKSLEFQLVKLMTEPVPYGDNGGVNPKDKKHETLVGSLKTLNELCIKDSKALDELQSYLMLWESYGFTAPQTIYLYLIAMRK